MTVLELGLYVSDFVLVRQGIVLHDLGGADHGRGHVIESFVGATLVSSSRPGPRNNNRHVGDVLAVLSFEKCPS